VAIPPPPAPPAPPPAVQPTESNAAGAFLSDLAVVPLKLASFAQDPRTHRLHLDVIGAEVLTAVSLALCVVLLELRRRRLV